jgi:hypothetical protein
MGLLAICRLVLLSLGVSLLACGCGQAGGQIPSPTPAGVGPTPMVGTAVPPSGTVQSPPLGSITPTGVPEPGSLPPLTPDAGGTVTVTLNDLNRVVEMHVGDALQLSLEAPGYDWQVGVGDRQILREEIAPTGGKGLYRAIAPGTTTLHAEGLLPCHKANPPCEAPTRTFEITVHVR